MNRLSVPQFTSLLLINDFFTLICLSGAVSLTTLAGAVLGSIIQMISCIYIVRLTSSGGGIDKRWLCIVLCGYIILWGGEIFSMLWSTSEVIYIPYESGGIAGKLAVGAVLGAVCLYCASCGIKALARASVIAAGMGILSLAVVIISAVTGAHWENLTAPESQTIRSQTLRCLSLSGGIGSFIVLLGNADCKPEKALISYFTGKIALCAVILIPTLLLTGGIISITEFPVVMASQLSQPFSSQRIDSLFLLVFSVSGVFAAALQTNTAAGLLKIAFPGFHKMRNLTIISAMILSAALIGQMRLSWLTALIVPLLPVLPAVRHRRQPQTLSRRKTQ